jgi:hypothetical protein
MQTKKIKTSREIGEKVKKKNLKNLVLQVAKLATRVKT